MTKWLRGLAAGAALMWAGSAQAATTITIGPGVGAEVYFGSVLLADWTSLADGPATYFADALFDGYLTIIADDCQYYGTCEVHYVQSGNWSEFNAGTAPASEYFAVPAYTAMNTKITFTSLSGGAIDLTFNSPVGIKILALPEPTTWAMMLVGFGLAGAVLRRRPLTQTPPSITNVPV